MNIERLVKLGLGAKLAYLAVMLVYLSGDNRRLAYVVSLSMN